MHSWCLPGRNEGRAANQDVDMAGQGSNADQSVRRSCSSSAGNVVRRKASLDAATGCPSRGYVAGRRTMRHIQNLRGVDRIGGAYFRCGQTMSQYTALCSTVTKLIDTMSGSPGRSNASRECGRVFV